MPCRWCKRPHPVAASFTLHVARTPRPAPPDLCDAHPFTMCPHLKVVSGFLLCCKLHGSRDPNLSIPDPRLHFTCARTWAAHLPYQSRSLPPSNNQSLIGARGSPGWREGDPARAELMTDRPAWRPGLRTCWPVGQAPPFTGLMSGKGFT